MGSVSAMDLPLALDDERYKKATVAVFVLALFVQILDGTIINVAIPTLAEAFEVSDADIDRAIISYLVSLAVFIPASGWLADRFGSRRVFILALTVFTVASVLCAAAQSLGQLVAFRLLQGAGAGVMGPLGAAILYRAFPQSERARPATAVMGVAVIAPATGPVIGGAIIQSLSWRWIFLVNLPIGLVAGIVGLAVIRDFRVEARARFDLAGFVLAGLGLGATLFGVTVAKDEGWTSPIVLGTVGVGLASLAALPAVERRVEAPLLKLDLFRAPIFRSISITAFPLYAAFIGPVFLLPVYLQSLRGFDALETGLATFPQALGVMVSSQVGGRHLYRRLGPRRMLLGGLAGAFVIGLLMARLDMGSSLWTVRALMFGRGFALGFGFIAIQTSIYAQTSVEDTAQATSLFSANRQSAPAFGVALAAGVLAATATNAAEPELADFQLSFGVLALVFVPAMIAALFVRDEHAAATLAR